MMAEIVLALILMVLAGFCEAVMDTIHHHFNDSIFKVKRMSIWLDPEFSWMNKYKNGDPKQGPKFFGSTTFLVWTTDAWHLFKAKRTLFFTCGVVLLAAYGETLFQSFLFAAIGVGLKGLVFELFYSKILRDETK